MGGKVATEYRNEITSAAPNSVTNTLYDRTATEANYEYRGMTRTFVDSAAGLATVAAIVNTLEAQAVYIGGGGYNIRHVVKTVTAWAEV